METLLFTSSFCRFCGPAKNILRSNNIPFREVDVEKDTDISVKYRVRSLPTIITLEADEEVFRWSGVPTAQCLDKMVSMLFVSMKEA
jgi:glutaredoxin